MTANELPDDAKALWIVFKGREWVVMWHPGHYFAYPIDNLPASKTEIHNLFCYLKQEGFINEDDSPTTKTIEP